MCPTKKNKNPAKARRQLADHPPHNTIKMTVQQLCILRGLPDITSPLPALLYTPKIPAFSPCLLTVITRKIFYLDLLNPLLLSRFARFAPRSTEPKVRIRVGSRRIQPLSQAHFWRTENAS